MHAGEDLRDLSNRQLEAVNSKQVTDEIASTYLLDFFTAGGRSVLVRGDPGTGKTSFVLQLLDYHSKNNFKSVYMSTRLSAKTLKSHQPWVEMVQGRYGAVPRLAGDQIGFQDSRRMDGVRAISGLRSYLEQVENPFVVLDSWEGLFFDSHTMGVEEISKLVEDYDARFVVVTERREQTDLDYLLDGVIVLRRKFHRGRVLREIELRKLRGVSIQQSRFIFTLDQGKFRYLPPLSTEKVSETGSVGEPIPSGKQGLYSSGAESLDHIVGGGFAEGSMNLVELSSELPSGVIALFLRTVLSNFINGGHRVLYVPFMGSARAQIEAALPQMSRETISGSVSFLDYRTPTKKIGTKAETLVGDAAQDFQTIDSKLEELSKDSDKPLLVVLGQDAMEGLYGADSVSNFLARSIAHSKSLGNVRLQLSSPESTLTSEARPLSDLNMRIELVDGAPVAYSIKPFSVLFGLTNDGASPGRLALVPVV